MGKHGFLDIGIVSFVFTPLILTITLLFVIWWRRVRDNRAWLDAPELLLAAVVRGLPEERREWGWAMLAELGQLRGVAVRWWFALSCARAALLPPRHSGLLISHNPICGVWAVALPPLGLPLLYLAALIAETILKQEGVSISELYPGLGRTLGLFSLACVLAGLPLGLAGLLRRERMRRLSLLGMLSSLSIIGYFLLVMHLFAGGPHGD